jgi:hypothetical protein
MDDVDTELFMLLVEEKVAELREESMRWKSFQSPMPVTTLMKDTYRDAGARSCVNRGQESIIPNLLYARKKRLRVSKTLDLAFLQEKPTKIVKTILFPL